MKRIFLIFAAVVALTSLNGGAQLLWRVEGSGSARPSYIFGTHHLAPTAMVDSIAGLAEAIESVEAAYSELDMMHGALEQAQTDLMRYAIAPADSTLSKLLTTEELAKAGECVVSLMGPAASINSFEPLKPAMLTMVLSMLANSQAMPEFDPNDQIDREVVKRVAERSLPTYGLESPELQARMLLCTPLDEQAADLVKLTADMDQGIRQALRLAAAYRNGDLDALFTIMNDPEHGMTDAEADRMINSRNDAWIETLLGILPTASVMIVVGAGHLPGARGLIEQLRSHGYKVTGVTAE